MTGTFINVAAILIGGTIGLLFGSRIPERFKNTVIAGMGLFTAALGLQMFFKSENSLIVLGALIIGALLGEWIGIEDGLQAFGQMLEKRFSRDTETGCQFQICARLYGFLPAFLHWTHRHPRLHSGRVDRRLQIAGCEIHTGWICVHRIRIHAGSGGAVLFASHPHLSGRSQPAGESTQRNCDRPNDG